MLKSSSYLSRQPNAAGVVPYTDDEHADLGPSCTRVRTLRSGFPPATNSCTGSIC